jgi:hypothetical protein
VSYEDFVASKLAVSPPTGFDPGERMPAWLFPFQADLTRWALRRGRAAIFAGTGLGKMRMELAWTSGILAAGEARRALILAPLAVARQLAREAEAVGIGARVCSSQADVVDGLNVTNYDRVHLFDPADFDAVALDESSCIKHYNSGTLRDLLAAFGSTRYRLAATATPAPNDWPELGTHAEFLGVCSRTEMLSEYFVHDGGDTSVWRLKGHARRAFWRWCSTWGAMIGHPRDLGYDMPGYDLPPLKVTEHISRVSRSTVEAAGLLFAEEAGSLMERREARKASLGDRVKACAEVVAAEPDEPWVVWCDLNAEDDALRAAIPGAVSIRGSMTTEEKEATLEAFSEGRIRVLVTKPSICGWGLNWQHCARMGFVGVTDSWEAYYQAIRRVYRFGQKRRVHVHIFASEAEGSVLANLKRKEADALAMQEALSVETRDAVLAHVRGLVRETNDYAPTKALEVPSWLKSA